ncbi:hypothetical protein NP233_g7116 [Leucocoprinus birnbaumii]|uniref:Uncharacterized protein n=1 Tax=Leucocoprinus birnbaumii TaxID=56174 RepID=A0AAD5VS70_9AGAR|nr:hypothetical protein NP233_g7116 [Leucocoprinus birnbaumii]
MLLAPLPAFFLTPTTSPFIYITALLLAKVFFTLLCALRTIISLPQNAINWLGDISCSLIDGIVFGFLALGQKVADCLRSVFFEYAICLLMALHEAPLSANCRHRRSSDGSSLVSRWGQVTLEASKGETENDEDQAFPRNAVSDIVVDGSKIPSITGIDNTSTLCHTDEYTVLILPSGQLGPGTSLYRPQPIFSFSHRLRSLIQFNIASNPPSCSGTTRSTTKSRLRSTSRNIHRPKRRATGLRNSISANSLTGLLLKDEQQSDARQDVPIVVANVPMSLKTPLTPSKVNAKAEHPTRRRSESFRNLVDKLKEFQRIFNGVDC